MTKQIYNFLYSVFPAEHQWKISLLAQWGQIIGNLKDKVILEQINNDTIILTVIHSSWAQELSMLSPLLIKKVNALVGCEQIKHIKFKVGDVTFRKRIDGTHLKREVIKEATLVSENSFEHKTVVVLSVKENEALKKVASKELADELMHFYGRCKRVTQKTTR